MEFNNSDKFAVVLACLAGVMAIVLFLIEKRPPSVMTTLLILMALLAVYPVMYFIGRATWRAVTLLAVIVCTVLFGYYVWPHKEPAKEDQITVTRHDVEKQLAPEQIKTDVTVAATVKRKVAPDVKRAVRQKVAPPVQSCPNGICIGGDNNGTATVNNYGFSLPIVTWNFDPSAVKPDAVHPQKCVDVHIDRMFVDAKFGVLCDRECKALPSFAFGKAGGINQGDWGTIPNHPEIAAFVVNAPNPMPKDYILKACVESPDANPIKVLAVKTLVIDPHAKP